ncbi:DNA polymerase bacteriophage-type [Oryzomicrobium terrae]|uniref:Type-4 uracil-DNA glycosylase n=1 Tax=Oryzomicrobium terrae TaxID=1735038 RepID=A0A5C1E9R8_9RHOO|nr:uracil-DNA glycosylase [Oryzomicrobium terrae]QEL64907.1 DNA polymerase bacteriophage-type [Oryzomicrobium terrae]
MKPVLLSREALLAEMGISPVWVPRQGDGADTAASPADEATQAALQATPEMAAPAPAAPSRATPPAAARGTGGPATVAEIPPGLSWPELRQTIAACRACGLCEQRTQTVPGVGDEQADWLFIGEGPGADEDAQGEPFVGQAGKLLDAMLAAIDLKRGDDVYIANAVKCRPPGNRTPEPAEMAACRPFLTRQIELLQPKLLVLLGRAAADSVLGLEKPLAALRGRVHEYQGIPVVVTYHPAYLLRNLPEKAKAWEDLLFARRTMAKLKSGG